MRRYLDRQDGARILAGELAPLIDQRPIVVGLPRGGVPVAAEVARALGAPLDVIVVRKLGVPFQTEVGMGAVGEGGVRVLDTDLVRRLGLSSGEVNEIEARERAEVERRAARFRGDIPAVSLEGRVVVIVDDGIATGSTALAAVAVARANGAARVIVAAPVGAPDTLVRLGRVADAVVCPWRPPHFGAVGAYYGDFGPVSEEQVHHLLAASRGIDDETRLVVDGAGLEGELVVPPRARGLVVFAHGSGSSRHSPRNRFVAGLLNDGGFATLLVDLLTPDEALQHATVFDIDLLTTRLLAVVDWVRHEPRTADLPVGLFGASTGAAGALCAAAAAPGEIAAVVSRGGRPDLAGSALGAVQAPTLLIVGARDDVVLTLNEDAAQALTCEHRLVVVPGATHLFEEPGTLEVAANLARAWFLQHLDGDMSPTLARNGSTSA
jgi:putative phosphoribosyl transferase